MTDQERAAAWITTVDLAYLPTWALARDGLAAEFAAVRDEERTALLAACDALGHAATTVLAALHHLSEARS